MRRSKISEDLRMAGGIGARWIREAKAADEAEDGGEIEWTSKDLLVEIVYSMRFVSMLSQTMHWLVVGPSSGQDHELFKKVYSSVNDMLDSLAERVVGTEELDASDLSVSDQAGAVSDYGDASEDDHTAMHDGGMGSKLLLEELSYILELIEEADGLDVSVGTCNLLEGQADTIDQLMYHLGRRTRTA